MESLYDWVFKGKLRSAEQLVYRTMHFWEQHMRASPSEKGGLGCGQPRGRQLQWEKPVQPFYKLNVDGALFSDKGSIIKVIWDWNGCVIPVVGR